MSKSVVPAAAAAHAKHLVRNKKLTKIVRDEQAAQDEQQPVAHKDEVANAVQAQHAASMADMSLGGFSFANALSNASTSTASFAAESSAQGDSGLDDDHDSSGTLLLIAAIGLVGAGVAVLAGGGGHKNKAPTFAATTQAVTTNEDTAATVTATATDPNAKDVLSYSITTAPTKGTVTGGTTDGKFTYTPNANVNGTDSFIVTVNDGKGGTATQTVNVTITAVNDAPVYAAATQAVTGNEDTVISGTSAATDVDNATLAYTVTQGAHGTVTIGAADGKFTYTPNANYNGADSFTVTASDGSKTATQTVNVTVAAVNDAPVIASSTPSTITVHSGKNSTITVTATDVDGDKLTTTTTTPGHGTVTVNADGTLTYAPAAGFAGDDTFTIKVSDGTATVSQDVKVTVTNTAPVIDAATPSTLTVNSGQNASFTVKATDADGDKLTTTTTTPAHGAVTTNADGSLTYTPTSGYLGDDTFTIKVTDGVSTVSQDVKVSVISAITTTSIDIGQPSGDPTPLNAGAGKFAFTDDATKNTHVIIANMTNDDVIQVTNATVDKYNFGTIGTTGDLQITYNTNDFNNIIILDNAVAPDALVFDLASAVQAVGFNFITFG